jgi:hypothetical protein
MLLALAWRPRRSGNAPLVPPPFGPDRPGWRQARPSFLPPFVRDSPPFRFQLLRISIRMPL